MITSVLLSLLLSLSHNIQALMSRTQHDGSEQWFLGMFGTYVFLVLLLGSQKLTGNWMSWNVDSKSR